MAKIDKTIEDKLKNFIKKLNNMGISVIEAYLYGSYSKHKENEWSDIDVAIISPDFSEDRHEERVRLMKLSLDIDSRIEPVPFRPENFTDEDPLAWEVKTNGVQLI